MNWKPRVKSIGWGYWIVLRMGAHGWEKEWTYNRVFPKWRDAVNKCIAASYKRVRQMTVS